MSIVREILDNKGGIIWSVHPETTTYEALQVLADRNIGAVLVMDGDKLVGIFSERDYARKVILMGKSSRETPVRDLMTTAVFTVKLSDSLDYCLKMMTDRHIRHLPVLEKNRVVGVVTIGDVVKHIITLQKTAIQNLEEYITAR